VADLVSIASAHRAEADKAKHRTLAFAVILVLVHLLDIRPSEAGALGLKVAVRDPVIVYGAIALIFGYYFSRFISENNKAETYLPLNFQTDRRSMRACLRIAKISHLRSKKRKTVQTVKKLKRSALFFFWADQLILFPYRFIAVIFVLAAIVFMFIDLYGLGWLIWSQSPLIKEIWDY
jgi:hypothetical protein